MFLRSPSPSEAVARHPLSVAAPPPPHSKTPTNPVLAHQIHRRSLHRLFRGLLPSAAGVQ